MEIFSEQELFSPRRHQINQDLLDAIKRHQQAVNFLKDYNRVQKYLMGESIDDEVIITELGATIEWFGCALQILEKTSVIEYDSEVQKQAKEALGMYYYSRSIVVTYIIKRINKTLESELEKLAHERIFDNEHLVKEFDLPLRHPMAAGVSEESPSKISIFSEFKDDENIGIVLEEVDGESNCQLSFRGGTVQTRSHTVIILKSRDGMIARLIGKDIAVVGALTVPNLRYVCDVLSIEWIRLQRN